MSVFVTHSPVPYSRIGTYSPVYIAINITTYLSLHITQSRIPYSRTVQTPNSVLTPLYILLSPNARHVTQGHI